jgi:hypothetical protein
MAQDCSISPRQAYCYLEEARHLTAPVPVSNEKIAFTVKVPRGLVTKVRAYARAKRLSLSELVSRALRGGWHGDEAVPERARARRYTLQLEYRFDRLLAVKLERVYQLLVPDKRRPLGASPTGFRPHWEELNESPRRPLRSGLLGLPEGESHHRQPDRGAEGIRSHARLSDAG